MLIPLGTDVRLRRPTLVTYVLIALCAVVFLVQTFEDGRTGWSSGSPAAVTDVPFYYQYMLYGTDESVDRIIRQQAEANAGQRDVVYINTDRWYQYITYQFLHGGWMHLIGNMLFLFVFGPPVEDRLRRSGFLALYLVGGIFAGVVHGLFEVQTQSYEGVDYRSVAPVLGASGSIAAVTGAYLVLFPLAPVRLLSFFGAFMIRGWIFVVLSIAFDLFFLGIGNRGVAHFAHLGGYIGGAGIAMLLLWRKLIPRETYDLFSIARQAHRRRQYRELVTKGPGSSPFVKDVPGDRSSRVSAQAVDDRHAEERREVAALTKRDPEGATDRYLALLREDPNPTLGRDAQLVVANTIMQRGDHQNAVDAYDRFLDRYPSDREADQTRLMVAMVCTRQLNDPVCATKMLDALEVERLPEGLRPLVDTLREELG